MLNLPFDVSAFLRHLTFQLNPLIHCGLYGFNPLHNCDRQLCEATVD